MVYNLDVRLSAKLKRDVHCEPRKDISAPRLNNSPYLARSSEQEFLHDSADTKLLVKFSFTFIVQCDTISESGKCITYLFFITAKMWRHEYSETAFTMTTTNDYEVRKIHLGEDKEAWTIMGDIYKKGSIQIDACKYHVQYTGTSSEYEPTEENPNFFTPTYSWNTHTTTTNLDIPTSEVENLNTSWWGTPYASRS
ncbi:hypothetical protein TorRG33x02_201810 [Trema orientale]|uniref:Uncharacterized protein n=1 Tax=Trema orientale TaxID=63057 RepID=A0A2P5EET9_TREOI|nr:hypothetical protein TorRG33x02_201810 [Trema orientale]